MIKLHRQGFRWNCRSALLVVRVRMNQASALHRQEDSVVFLHVHANTQTEVFCSIEALKVDARIEHPSFLVGERYFLNSAIVDQEFHSTPIRSELASLL